MEERERLEEANERIEEALAKGKGKKGVKPKPVKEDKEDGEEDEDEEDDGERVLTEEEIDERCEVLRPRRRRVVLRGHLRVGRR
jgi:hypothetical protein